MPDFLRGGPEGIGVEDEEMASMTPVQGAHGVFLMGGKGGTHCVGVKDFLARQAMFGVKGGAAGVDAGESGGDAVPGVRIFDGVVTPGGEVGVDIGTPWEEARELGLMEALMGPGGVAAQVAWLNACDDVEFGQSTGVVGVHDLSVLETRSKLLANFGWNFGEGIEDLSGGGIADSMHGDLPSGVHEFGDPALQKAGPMGGKALLTAPVFVEEMCAGGTKGAVGKEFDCVDPQVLTFVGARKKVIQGGIEAVDPDIDENREALVAIEVAKDLEFLDGAPGHGGGGNAVAAQDPGRRQEHGLIFGQTWGGDGFDEGMHGSVDQIAGEPTRFIAVGGAPGRIDERRVDAGELQASGVGPEGVAVDAAKACRGVGKELIEEVAIEHFRGGEVMFVDVNAENPAGLAGRGILKARANFLDGEFAKIEGVSAQACAPEMNVGVPERRKDAGALGGVDGVVGTGESAGLVAVGEDVPVAN